MKRITLLIAAALLSACSAGRPPATAAPAASPPGGAHARHAAAKTARRIGADSFDIPFSELLSRFAHDSTTESDGYVWVQKGGKPLFGMSDKNDLQDRKVRLIYLISTDIQVGNDVHAGMSIDALLQIYPNLELDIGYNNDEVFSLPVPGGGGKNISILAVVRSKDGSRLASNDPERRAAGHLPYPTRHFSTAGHIDHLLIFGPSP